MLKPLLNAICSSPSLYAYFCCFFVLAFDKPMGGNWKGSLSRHNCGLKITAWVVSSFKQNFNDG